MKLFFAGVFTTLLVLFLTAVVSAKLGLIPTNADAKPGRLERTFAHTAEDAWMERHKATQANPFPPTEENLRAGMKLFSTNCAGCHGDAKGASDFGKAFYPSTPQFTLGHVPHDEDGVLFNLVAHGIRLTGMPAFSKAGMKDEEIWKTILFVKHLNDLSAPVQSAWKAPKT
jgi:mono/diheme cytochrome c family protein